MNIELATRAMNSLSPVSEPSASPAVAAARREPLETFLRFAAAVLKIDSRREGDVLELTADPEKHPDWPRPHRVEVLLAADQTARQKRQLDPAAGVQWMWQRARIAGAMLRGRPAHQPEAVHEFSSRLFAAYQVDGGQVHLAGCHLRDVPFVRLTFLQNDDPTTVAHRYLDAAGEPISESLVSELGLAEVAPLGDHSHLGSRAEAAAVLETMERGAERRGEHFDAATLIGAKWVDGTLQFNIDDQAVRLDFSGWTSTLTPPPYHCAASGLDTFHLAAIDDGRIVAAEAVATCEASGRRVLACEMETCSVTGKRVASDLVVRCPITGEPALESEFAECVVCRQTASKQALTDGICRACREWQRVDATDPRVSRVVDRFPALARYRRFRLNEMGGVLRLMAVGAWRRWLIVLAEHDHSPRAVATRPRFSRTWRHLDPSEWPAALGAK